VILLGLALVATTGAGAVPVRERRL
jgi:hypothetical protein